MTLKVAIIFHNYGPYHLARIQAFARQCQQKQWQSVGIELSRSETEYPWRTELSDLEFPIYSVLPDQKVEQVSFYQFVQKLYHLLQVISPDVLVISGYGETRMLAALIWGVWHRRFNILMSDTKADDASRDWWRENLKSMIIKGYDSALVAGQPHKRYLSGLGMPSHAISLGYDVVGNESFHPEKISLLCRPLEKPYFLAINRFIPKKNISFLLSAYADYCRLKGNEAWDLVLCGDGPLRAEIEQQVIKLGLESVVHLPGFLQQDQILPYFAYARCFIHASIQEQWGLVVNEAMAAGLPVLVSNRCGCVEDLLIEGVNGFSFDPENEQDLTHLLAKVSSGEVDLDTMGLAALQHIQRFSPDYFAKGLIQAVEYALTHR
jgi:1,2-diacylglycerol 3-alpha-glucosyltransferase